MNEGRQRIFLICIIRLQYFFNYLMTHESNVQRSFGFKHGLSSLKIIINNFNPIFNF